VAEDLDLPADVEATLTQLLAEGADAADAGDGETVRSVVGTVASVTRNKVPESELRDRLLFGCGTVETLLDGDADLRAAAGYLRAMRERVADA
jgi:hypothetical protein